MRSRKIKYVIIILAILTSLFLKLLYVTSNHQDLLFMLMPVQYLIEVFFNTKSVFITDTGFYFPDFNIVINKSCAGINFWIISFWVATTLLISVKYDIKYKFLKFIVLFVISYFFTLLVNTARITVAITALKLNNFIPLANTQWFHRAEGVFIYLIFLCVFSLALHYLLNKNNPAHA